MGAFGWEKYRIEVRYSLPGAGFWDYVTVDSASRRVFLSHETQVDVINAENGKLLGTIADTPGVHGIAIAAKSNRGFTSNGQEDKVTIFDAESAKGGSRDFRGAGRGTQMRWHVQPYSSAFDSHVSLLQ